MAQIRRFRCWLSLWIMLLLCSCGLPGIQIRPVATSQVSTTDRDATAAALRPTIAAQLAAERQQTATPQPDRSAQVTGTPTQRPAQDAARTSTPKAPTAAATTPVPPTPNRSRSPSELVAPAEAGTGVAIAIGQAGAVNVLRNNTWSVPTDPKGQCPHPTLAFDDADVIWLTCGDAYSSSDGGATWTATDEIAGNMRLFQSPRGPVWAIGGERAMVRVNGSWQTFRARDVIGQTSWPQGAAVFTPEGVAFFGGDTADRQLVSFDGTRWTTYPNIGIRRGPDTLLYSSRGELWAAAAGELFLFNGQRFTPVVTERRFRQLIGSSLSSKPFFDLVETPDGRIWMATTEGLFVWDGTRLQVHDTLEGLPSVAVYDLAVDAQGRLWAATGYGVALQNGKGWSVAQPSTSGLSDSFLRGITVQGAPSLPPPDPTTKTTTISGRVSRANTPIANVEVRLCSDDPGSRNERNLRSGPCSNNRYVVTVRTNAQGAYRFEDVPIGRYGLTIRERGGNWTIMAGLDVAALEPDREVRRNIAVH